MKEILLKYIDNSPYCLEKNWHDMSSSEILSALGAVIDKTEVSTDHSYSIVEIHNYAEALKYQEQAGEWCIIESEEAFDVHTDNGRNRFYFCIRDDARQWPQMAFGKSYPYDNYGLSMIAVCVDTWGHLVSVTSRWNWEEEIDNYMTKEQLEALLNVKFEEVFKPIERKPLRILHISDTHGQHKKLTNLPDADVIVHSGDFTPDGNEDDVFDFLNWFCDLPYKHKIFIAGQTDDCLFACNNIEGLDENCHYLTNTSVIINGVKFFGIMGFVQNFFFMDYETLLRTIPDDTDVVISHNSPLGILDNSDCDLNMNKTLLERIKEIKPKLHLFGYSHNYNGQVEKDGTIFSNACFVDDKLEANDTAYRVLTI